MLYNYEQIVNETVFHVKQCSRRRLRTQISEELGVKGHFVPIINGKLEMASGKFRNCVGIIKMPDASSQMPGASRVGNRKERGSCPFRLGAIRLPLYVIVWVRLFTRNTLRVFPTVVLS